MSRAARERRRGSRGSLVATGGASNYPCTSLLLASWTETFTGTAAGALLAGAIGALGWQLNRRRLRRAIARVLFFEVKFVRTDWLGNIGEGGSGRGYEPLLTSWRALQHVCADLFPRPLIGRLVELTQFIDRVTSGTHTLTVPEGVDDLRAIAARAERDLAAAGGETFDPATAEWLATHEKRWGNKP